MAENQEQPEEESPSEPSAESSPAAGSHAENEAGQQQDGSAEHFADDELPEEEELTPEIVEEEAIRGDFMLRWAAILLMVLFAFSKFNDTRVLVHIRSGEQMQADGFMPARTDALSFTAEGQAAPNTSWLLDHVFAMTWGLGGDAGLTMFKVLIAAIIGYIFSRISVPQMPTWWNSICGMLLAAAVAGHLMPAMELVTLLGVLLILRWLHQYHEGTARGLAWKIPALIAVWCNFDPRAWVGVVIVLLYAVGEIMRQRRARLASAAVDEVGTGEPLWLAGLVSAFALLVNPFPTNSLFAPVAYYSIEVPSMQFQRPVNSDLAGISHDNRVDYFSALNPDAVRMFDHTQITALALIVIALVVLAISRSRTDLPLTVTLVGMTLLGLAAVHELPAAAVTAAVVAATVAQRWYRRNFRQTYSVDSRELMFSRGGRAATVFAMAFLAFCIVAGRLPGRTPLGIGFEPDMATTIDTLGEQLASVDEDARILNTRIDQGDILIWHGRKSCIDSRLIPFGRPSNTESILFRHREILERLLHPQPPQRPDRPMNADEQQKFDKLVSDYQESVGRAMETLNEFEVTHMMPRLAPPGRPDYVSVRSLLGSDQWILTSIGPSAALMEKVKREWTTEEREQKAVDVFDRAFRTVEPQNVLRQFAQPANFYETWVYRRRPTQSRHVRLAGHYLTFANSQTTSLQEILTSMAFATLAIREGNLALTEDSQSGRAWRQLGIALQRLGMLEESLADAQGVQNLRKMRYLQAVTALRQAVKIDPQDYEAWQYLALEYDRQGCLDLLAECFRNIPPPDASDAADPQVQAMATSRYERERELNDSIRAENEAINELLESNPLPDDPVERGQQVTLLASRVAQDGFPGRALEVLREHGGDLNLLTPIGRLLLGELMMQTGEADEAASALSVLASQARDYPDQFAAVTWQSVVAASQLTQGNFGEAASMLNLQAQQVEGAEDAYETWSTAMMTPPVVADTDLSVRSRVPLWPVMHTQGLQIPMKGLPAVRAGILLQSALVHIEEGNTERARLFLRSVIADFGDTPFRTLAIYYLLMLDEDAREFVDQFTVDDWEPDTYFTADEQGESADDPAAGNAENL